jgi:streptomycin 6-kinase
MPIPWPDVLARACDRFHIGDLARLTGFKGARLLFARTDDGEEVVLKVTPNPRHLAAEVETLRAFGEDRAVAVRDVWLEEGMALLERVRPGTAIASEASEDQALDMTAQVLAQGWPAVPNGTVAEPIDRFLDTLERAMAEQSTGARACPVDRALLQRAHAMLRELLGDDAPPVLLHGDLHYGNILRSDRAGQLLIDPKGMIGEPAFDVGYLVSRPAPTARDALPLTRALDRRLVMLPAATRQDRSRVAAFAFVAAALSAVWALEDDEPACAFEEMMAALSPRV